MKMQAVSSTALAAIGHDAKKQKMRVVFVNGGVYDFNNVTRHVYTAFRIAKSKGLHFTRHIKGRYNSDLLVPAAL